MPIYEYSCPQCDSVFEEWQKDFMERDMKCPHCGAPSKRLISNTAFILKGTGWYVTDYANGKKNGDHGADKTEAKANGDSAPAKTNGDQAGNNGKSAPESSKKANPSETKGANSSKETKATSSS